MTLYLGGLWGSVTRPSWLLSGVRTEHHTCNTKQPQWVFTARTSIKKKIRKSTCHFVTRKSTIIFGWFPDIHLNLPSNIHPDFNSKSTYSDFNSKNIYSDFNSNISLILSLIFTMILTLIFTLYSTLISTIIITRS